MARRIPSSRSRSRSAVRGGVHDGVIARRPDGGHRRQRRRRPPLGRLDRPERLSLSRHGPVYGLAFRPDGKVLPRPGGTGPSDCGTPAAATCARSRSRRRLGGGLRPRRQVPRLGGAGRDRPRLGRRDGPAVASLAGTTGRSTASPSRATARASRPAAATARCICGRRFARGGELARGEKSRVRSFRAAGTPW